MINIIYRAINHHINFRTRQSHGLISLCTGPFKALVTIKPETQLLGENDLKLTAELPKTKPLRNSLQF